MDTFGTPDFLFPVFDEFMMFVDASFLVSSLDYGAYGSCHEITHRTSCSLWLIILERHI